MTRDIGLDINASPDEECNDINCPFHQRAGSGLGDDGAPVGPPVVKWVTASINGGDDGGEKEDITEEVKKVAAEAAAGGGRQEGASAGGDGEPWVFKTGDDTDQRRRGGDGRN